MATSPFITDVTSAIFETEVLQRSHKTPVLVDFWAAWCGPCQMLMPILAKLAEEYQGRFFLAKVNSDEQQDVAARFGVRSLPTVKLFKNGAEVGSFMGVQPERTIRDLLDRHIARPSDTQLQQALETENNGDKAGACAILSLTHTDDPANDRVTVHLGRILLELGRVQESEETLSHLSIRGRGDPELAPILTRLSFVRLAMQAPPTPDLEKQLERNPDDLHAKLLLGARYLLSGQTEQALEQWLAIVRTDRHFEEDIGRRTLLQAFSLLGGKGDLVQKYRRLLALAIN